VLAERHRPRSFVIAGHSRSQNGVAFAFAPRLARTRWANPPCVLIRKGRSVIPLGTD